MLCSEGSMDLREMRRITEIAWIKFTKASHWSERQTWKHGSNPEKKPGAGLFILKQSIMSPLRFIPVKFSGWWANPDVAKPRWAGPSSGLSSLRLATSSLMVQTSPFCREKNSGDSEKISRSSSRTLIAH